MWVTINASITLDGVNLSVNTCDSKDCKEIQIEQERAKFISDIREIQLLIFISSSLSS